MIQSHTLHESGNSGEIKKMFADENFALQKNPHCCSAHGCQLFSLISAKRNAFYAKLLSKIRNHFCSPKTVYNWDPIYKGS